MKTWKAGICVASLLASALAQAQQPHNVILFVPDGLRAGIVDAKTAPTFADVRKRGIHFQNTHSLFPTFTTPNASAMATGHYLGDTGDFSNTIYVGFPLTSAHGSVTPFLENDAVLDEVDDHFASNYLDEETVLTAARNAGFLTAAIGKLGPTAIQAVPDLKDAQTIVIDDATNATVDDKAGIALSADMIAALQNAGLPTAAPGRGDNKNAGDIHNAGTLVANVEQQKYFVDVATKVILPRFKNAGKPFVLVFWSRDPDGTQHNQGDSPNALVPGINGPTSLAAIRNADDNLKQILATLKALGLDKTTDVVISADHGFSTISKQSDTSNAAKGTYADTPAGQLPSGFVALDLAQALNLPLADPDAKNTVIAAGAHPKKGNGLIGHDANAPDVVVAANGGSDLIYLPQSNAHDLAPKVVDALLAQDYVSGIFVDDALGDIPGTLPLSAINLKGSALTPMPAIVVNFRSFDTGCGKPLLCAVEIADTGLQQGHGMHGNFSRADTSNFMAAIGPDFRHGYIDSAPTSNADVGQTLAYLLHLDVPHHGALVGRVLTEALVNGKPVIAKKRTVISKPALDGAQTILQEQTVGDTLYFDVAGFAGKTVGLTAKEAAQR